MARRERKYHVIYKITNIKNQRYYVGMHSTDNINDSYFGGGDIIKNSVKKHGRESHTKEILEYLPNRKSLAERERQIVNEELLNDPKCMNIMKGGEGGGFINDEHMRKCSKAGNDKFRELLKDPDYKKEFIEKTKGAETWKRLHSEGKIKYDTFTGKSHSEETKKIVGEKNSINQSGKLNSQFDKIWIRNLESKETIKISQSELDYYLKSGWERGRLANVPRKLTEDIVKEIKLKLLEGFDCVKISKMFSTTPSTVKAIKWGNSWSHVKL